LRVQVLFDGEAVVAGVSVLTVAESTCRFAMEKRGMAASASLTTRGDGGSRVSACAD
jgi:hypothetical protein